MKEQPPQGIEDLLNASPQQLEQWGGDVSLAEPEEYSAETRMAQAWLQQEHPPPPETVSLWDNILQSIASYWMIPTFATVAIAIVLVWKWPTPSPHTLTPKGVRVRSVGSLISLHLGTSTKSGKLQRLAQRNDGGQNIQELSKKQALLLGFTLKQPGYLTIWCQQQGSAPLLLFGKDPKSSRKWKQGFSTFSMGGVNQEYSLASHNGKLVFAVTWSKQPMSAQTSQDLQNSPNLIEGLQRLSSRNNRKLSFDSYTVRVK